MLTSEEAKKLPAVGKIVDMAKFLSIVRYTTSEKLAIRYGVRDDYKLKPLVEQSCI